MDKARVRYIGHRERLELGSSWVSTPVCFCKENNFIAEMSLEDAHSLIRDNPRSFEVVVIFQPAPEFSGDKLTRVGLAKKTAKELEKLANELFGVDLDRRKKKAQLVEDILILQDKLYLDMDNA